MFVYKSIYNSVDSPSINDKNIVIPETNETIVFKIYILPENTNVYDIIVNATKFALISMTQTNCLIYIVCDHKLTIENLNLIEKHISINYSNVTKDDDVYNYKHIETLENANNIINLYGNVTLHFSNHNNNIYDYINYSCPNNAINMYDTRVNYVVFNDRFNFSNVHGKVLDNGNISMFYLYPLPNTYRIYILPDEFVIIKEADNKIAYVKHNDCIFWIATHFTFINNNVSHPLYNTTQFCPQSQNVDQMMYIFSIFKQYKFEVPQIMRSCILAEDEKNGILMFIGVLNLQFKPQYSIYFEKILGK